MEVVDEESADVKRRRTEMCPEEWNESFGEEFYDHALENSFYFLAPRTDWRATSQSVAAPGIPQMSVKTEDELETVLEKLKAKEDDDNG